MDCNLHWTYWACEPTFLMQDGMQLHTHHLFLRGLPPERLPASCWGITGLMKSNQDTLPHSINLWTKHLGLVQHMTAATGSPTNWAPNLPPPAKSSANAFLGGGSVLHIDWIKAAPVAVAKQSDHAYRQCLASVSGHPSLLPWKHDTSKKFLQL